MRVRVREDIKPLHRSMGRMIRAGEKGDEIRRYTESGQYAPSSRSVVVFEADPDVQHNVPTRFLARDHHHALLNCNEPGCPGGYWQTDPFGDQDQ